MWLRGLQYLGSFTQHHLGLVLLGIWGVWKGLERGNARDQVTLLVIPVYLLYVVSVGGDFKHSGRFLLPVLPLFALWAQEGLGRLLDAMGAGSRARLALGAGSVLFCAWNQVQYWPIPYSSAVYRVQNQVERVEVGQFLRTAFPPDTWIAIHSAGTVPYISGLPTIDCWGLSDLHIARIDVEGLGSGIAGHEKTDYAYVFSRTPTVYLPEKDLVTPRPHRLVVPKDFPASFEEQYVQRSARLPSGKAVNLWLHRTARGLSPSSPGEDGPGGD